MDGVTFGGSLNLTWRSAQHSSNCIKLETWESRGPRGESTCALPQIRSSCALGQGIKATRGEFDCQSVHRSDICVYQIFTHRMVSIKKKKIHTHTHKHQDSCCTLHDPYFGQDSEKKEGGCRHGCWPVSPDQAAGWNQQGHDKSTMELGPPGILWITASKEPVWQCFVRIPVSHFTQGAKGSFILRQTLVVILLTRIIRSQISP